MRDGVGEELLQWPPAAFHPEFAAAEVGSVELRGFCLFNASWVWFWGGTSISRDSLKFKFWHCWPFSLKFNTSTQGAGATCRDLQGFFSLGASCHVAFVCYNPLGLGTDRIRSPFLLPFQPNPCSEEFAAVKPEGIDPVPQKKAAAPNRAAPAGTFHKE